MVVPKRFHDGGTKKSKKFFNKETFTHLRTLFNFITKTFLTKVKKKEKLRKEKRKRKSSNAKIGICLSNKT